MHSGASEGLYKSRIFVHTKPILLFAQGGELDTCTVTAQAYCLQTLAFALAVAALTAPTVPACCRTERLVMPALLPKPAGSQPDSHTSALQGSELRKNSALLDLDTQWSGEPNFVVYDYNNPENIPENIHHTFDCVVMDPPFITHEVWNQYAAAAKLLLAPEGELCVKPCMATTPAQCISSKHVLLHVLFSKRSRFCSAISQLHLLHICRPYTSEYHPRE